MDFIWKKGKTNKQKNTAYLKTARVRDQSTRGFLSSNFARLFIRCRPPKTKAAYRAENRKDFFLGTNRKTKSYEIKVFTALKIYPWECTPFPPKREMWVHLATWWLVTPPLIKPAIQVNSCQDRCIFFCGLCNSKHFIHMVLRYKEKHFYQENWFSEFVDNFID